MENTKSEIFVKVLKYYNLFQPINKYKVICPFHKDFNASLQINIPEAFFFCYGCNVHGSTEELVKLQNPGISDIKTQILISKICKNVNCDQQTKSSIYNIYNIYNNIYINNNNIYNKINASNYYNTLPSVNWFCVRKDNINYSVKRYLLDRGFTCKILNKFKAKINENENYKVIFPMFDNTIFKGYVCRTTDKEIEKQRKYLYNKGFRRKNSLIGEYSGKYIITVEGFMDMLKARQLGFENVVALMGWKASQRQIEKIKNSGAKKIICALDNDECGEKGYRFLLDHSGLDVFRLKYPEGIKDFGDLKSECIEFVKVRRQIYKQLL